ncbi:MAG: PIN domain-containing protein [Vicinamibacterales bacterium]
MSGERTEIEKMIAADSSSLIAYFSGSTGADVDAIDRSLADNQLCLPPVVLTELLSDPKLPDELASALRRIPLLDTTEGFWDRAGVLRAGIITRKKRARLADTLIAQTCLDHDVMLITRDADFRSFNQFAGLKLAGDIP